MRGACASARLHLLQPLACQNRASVAAAAQGGKPQVGKPGWQFSLSLKLLALPARCDKMILHAPYSTARKHACCTRHLRVSVRCIAHAALVPELYVLLGHCCTAAICNMVLKSFLAGHCPPSPRSSAQFTQCRKCKEMDSCLAIQGSPCCCLQQYGT